MNGPLGPRQRTDHRIPASARQIPSPPAGRATSDFDYAFPQSAVADRPLPDRASSRLLHLDRRSGTVAHRRFSDFPTLLHSGDALVLNASRVVPARLKGVRENGREAEILLVHPESDGTWIAMVHPGGKLKTGRTVRFADEAVAEIVGVLGDGLRRVRLRGLSGGDLMAQFGSIPLPPYIERPADALDVERYQTVYARQDGSVAAPTAGLHFTRETLDAVRDRGVSIAETVLHVGPATFKPVEVEDPSRHRMHVEWYSVSAEAAQTINTARRGGGRVFAVGTTAVRTLESACGPDGIRQAEGWTELFIRPPHQFRVVDAVLTNFHLPRSTLLMLVAAFAGYESTMRAYREAVAAEYRLFSYGDAMAIV